ncbi:MAG: DNA-binding response regulator [Gammaproteobacteria bacterium]|nr:MAG: DNA-binding response regulator [Gammaproteobacteria bacterium]
MRILIADDEPLARERLRGLLARLGEAHVVGEAADGRSAVEQAARLAPDVVLLDIRMPVMDGLEAARHIAALPAPPAVIFTTAFEEHALEAFEAAACDYLVKPIRAERLQQALAGARRLTRPQVQRLQPDAPRHREALAVRYRGRLQLVPIEAVRCFRADSKYTVVCTPEGEFLIEEPLKALEEEFAGRFLRVHRNALVNLEYLARLQPAGNGRYRLYLHGLEAPVEVSRRHAARVRARFEPGRARDEQELGDRS